MADTEEPSYGLVMPFIVTKSNGGVLDDRSFVCGVTCGEVWAHLAALPSWAMEYRRYVETEVVAQLDLIGMHFGWQMTAEPWADFPDEWTLVSFARPRPVPSEEDTP